MSRAGVGPGAADRNFGSMAARARDSCGRTLMKYDEVQQPTQSPHATSMPGPPASALRMARSHSEKLPAGRFMRAGSRSGCRADCGTRIEPRHGLGLGREYVAAGAAVLRHE